MRSYRGYRPTRAIRIVDSCAPPSPARHQRLPNRLRLNSNFDNNKKKPYSSSTVINNYLCVLQDQQRMPHERRRPKTSHCGRRNDRGNNREKTGATNRGTRHGNRGGTLSSKSRRRAPHRTHFTRLHPATRPAQIARRTII